ncbi:hypothetical protein KAW38_04650 [Candidatus Micrarchaeota archaeon]|nr:hypothetical protein [Candidatus Micrarchaeota archaeon]
MGLKEKVGKIKRLARILFRRSPEESKEGKGPGVRNASPLSKAMPVIEGINKGVGAEVVKKNTVFGPLKVKEYQDGTRTIEMNEKRGPIIPLISPEGFVEGAYFVEEREGRTIIKKHKAWHGLSKEEKETIWEMMERMGKPRLDPDSFKKQREGSAELEFVNLGVVKEGKHCRKFLKDVIGCATSMIGFRNVAKTFLVSTAEGEQYILTKESIENLYDKDPIFMSMDKNSALTIQSTRRETTRDFLIVPFKQ